MTIEQKEQALSLTKTIAANVNNEGLSDKEFRDFVRNSLGTVEGITDVIEKFTPKKEDLPKLRTNQDIMPFSMQDEDRYKSLISCNMLTKTYPFCNGVSFHADMDKYRELLKGYGLVSEGYVGTPEVKIES